MRRTSPARQDQSAPAAPGGEEREQDSRYRAPALDKGLDILELLSAQPAGMTRAEIVRAMGRSPSEIYRMLERLVSRDYVGRSPEGDRYALTLKLFVLAHRHPPVNRLVARATPTMEAFATATAQSCHLGVYDRGNLTVLVQVDSPGKLGFSLRRGARVSLVDTASGHVMLAFQDEARRAQMLAAHETLEGEVPLAARQLARILARVRRAGHFRGRSLQTFGITDLSVPVCGPDGHALAVLTCPFIRRIDRQPGPDEAATLTALAAAARQLSLG